jgi:hypothetical protein
MAQKTEKLSEEVLDNLRKSQIRANELVVGLGQIHLKLKNFKIEMGKMMEEQKNMEIEFELNDSKFTTILRDLEKQYPTGELDLNEGVVTYESPE